MTTNNERYAHYKHVFNQYTLRINAKYRKIRIFQPKNYISIDYIGQTLTVY
ncbi:MAG: hypothetical protein LBM22_00205 [Endomicrobium sp.]|jgi:hypothetical protein|nr:hypothetical protein [Endomicrobium sp.]